MANFDRVAIIGTGLIGASIGLGLKTARPSVRITGFDRSFDHARAAQRLKAVDRIASLPDAVSDADLVVLATPLDAMTELLEAMAPELKAGAVVMDTGGSKVEVIRAAADALGQQARFVGTDPMVGKAATGPDAAEAGLFRGSVWCVCPTTSADSAAIDGVLGVIDDLGAVPYFLDPGEHDGLSASVNQLPMLLASVLVQHLATEAGWREAAAVAATSFAYATQLADHNPRAVASAVLANRDNVVRRIDAFINALENAKALIADGNGDLVALLDQAQTHHLEWISGRAAHPEDADRQAMPTASTMLSTTFLGGLGRNRGGDKDDTQPRR